MEFVNLYSYFIQIDHAVAILVLKYTTCLMIPEVSTYQQLHVYKHVHQIITKDIIN